MPVACWVARNVLLDLKQMHQCVCQEPKSDKFPILLIYDHNISKWVILLKSKVDIENYLQFVLFCFPCGSLFCWSTVWAFCFLTWNTQKDYFNFKSSLPLLRKHACLCCASPPAVTIVLCQKTDLEFTPVDHFYTPVPSITSAGKKSCSLHRDVGVEKEFVLLCCTRQDVLLWGTWWHMYSFILAVFICLKNIFTTAVSLSSYPEFG